MTDPLTRVLAGHIAQVQDATLPVMTRDMAQRCILDALGAAIAGAGCRGPAATRASASALLGKGEFPVWMSTITASPFAAVLCNVSAASALDLDDGHRAARGHPGACVIPTVLTLAAHGQFTGSQVLSAVVAGYDIGVRIAASQNAKGIPTRQSGRWAGFAVVAAAASLMRVDPRHVEQALAIAGVIAPNQQANGSSGYARDTGNDVKEGIAWGAASGLTALHLAINGHSGPLDLLDHPDYYDPSRILDRLNRRWEIDATYFKIYSCCRYIHAPIDGLVAMIKAYDIRHQDIVRITIETFGWASRLGNKTDPQTLVDLQYSLPYCLAVATIDGPDALLPCTEDLLGRPDLSELAGRVAIVTDRDLDLQFPARTLARIAVQTSSACHRSSVIGPVGDPDRPLAFEALAEKFRHLTSKMVGASEQEAMVDGVLALADGQAAPLLTAVRSLSLQSTR